MYLHSASGFLYKLEPALGTGNRNLSPSLRHTDNLMAFWASVQIFGTVPLCELHPDIFKIIFHTVKDSHKLLVFPLPFIYIARKETEKISNYKNITQ